MSVAANKASFRKIPERIYNLGELDTSRAVMLGNYVEHVPMPAGYAAGRPGFEQLVQMWRTAVPDLAYTVTRFTPDDLIGEGDFVVHHLDARGTHRGPLFGVPATGRPLDWTETHIGRYENGMLVEHWAEIDTLRIVQAIGTIPGYTPRGPPPAPPVVLDERYLTAAQMRELLNRLVEEVWNAGRLKVADELFHPGATSPSAPDLSPGAAGVQALVTAFRSGFPDYHVAIEQTIVEYPYVVGRLVRTGTHDGQFADMAATGKSVSYGEILILRVGNGQIVESWSDVNLVGLMSQLGVGD